MVELLEEMEGQLCLAEIRGEWMGGCHDGGLLLLDQPWWLMIVKMERQLCWCCFGLSVWLGDTRWVQDCDRWRLRLGEWFQFEEMGR